MLDSTHCDCDLSVPAINSLIFMRALLRRVFTFTSTSADNLGCFSNAEFFYVAQREDLAINSRERFEGCKESGPRFFRSIRGHSKESASIR